MTLYAEGTKVPADRSRGEIERILTRYGADAFGYGFEPGRAVVTFRAAGRHVRMEVPMPTVADYGGTPTQRQAAVDRETRRLWRTLVLVMKAKLEAVSSGLVTFEAEFLSHLVLPNGQTVGEWTEPQIAAAYETGDMPALLPGGRT